MLHDIVTSKAVAFNALVLVLSILAAAGINVGITSETILSALVILTSAVNAVLHAITVRRIAEGKGILTGNFNGNG